MEDGVVQASEEGTPQGGLVSPVLSNIYLHYVLDLWFECWLTKRCRGKAFLVRYCDDFIALFEREEDARWFLDELPKRLVLLCRLQNKWVYLLKTGGCLCH